MRKFEVCIAAPSENWGPELVTVDADKFTYYGREPLSFEQCTGQEGCYRTVAIFNQWVYFRELSVVKAVDGLTEQSPAPSNFRFPQRDLACEPRN